MKGNEFLALQEWNKVADMTQRWQDNENWKEHPVIQILHYSNGENEDQRKFGGKNIMVMRLDSCTQGSEIPDLIPPPPQKVTFLK